METRACPVCDTGLVEGGEPWLLACPTCALLVSTATPVEQDFNTASTLIETRREEGLRPLRESNFQRILDLLERSGSIHGKRLLDVGCAYGWFAMEAMKRGMLPLGIEPEQEVANHARANGVDVRVGLFPDCLGPDERFDVVIFNDVLEHMTDLGSVLRACHGILPEGGRLVINIPDSEGVFYRIATQMAKLGVKRSLHRLWQLDFASPHRYYFNTQNLENLVRRNGFKTLLHRGSLASIKMRGFWSRLRMDENASQAGAVVTWGAIAAAYPLVRYVLHPDAMVHIYER